MGRAVTPTQIEHRLRYGIHYKVDFDKVNLLQALLGKEITFPDTINIKPTYLRPRTEGTWVTYRNLYDKAEELGIIPELFVDEDYYYSRVGLLPYRVAFAGLRKGMDLFEVYNALSETGYNVQPITFEYFVTGRRNTVKFTRVEWMERLCSVVGLEIADLFVPVFRRSKEGNVVFRVWKTALATLDSERIAKLVDITVALAQGKEVQVCEF